MGHAHIPSISPLTPKEAGHIKANLGNTPCHMLPPPHYIPALPELDLQSETMAESTLLNKPQPTTAWRPSFNPDTLLFMVRT